MKLNEIVEKLALKELTQGCIKDVEVAKGYSSDLLSDVMGNAGENDLWVTLQIHKNIVAVAVMKNLSGIVLVNNRAPDAETLQKANEEKVAILQSTMSTFEVTGRLYQMGLKGE
jgi:hypothetical protein